MGLTANNPGLFRPIAFAVAGLICGVVFTQFSLWVLWLGGSIFPLVIACAPLAAVWETTGMTDPQFELLVQIGGPLQFAAYAAVLGMHRPRRGMIGIALLHGLSLLIAFGAK